MMYHNKIIAYDIATYSEHKHNILLIYVKYLIQINTLLNENLFNLDC